MYSLALASHDDVKYSFTKKCARQTLRQTSKSMINNGRQTEHVDSTAFSGSAERQSGC